MRTCTISMSASGAKCGKAAVVTFTSRSGDALAECHEHDASFIAVAHEERAERKPRDRCCAACGHEHRRGVCRNVHCDCTDY